MRTKAASGIMLTLLLISVLTLAFNNQTVKAEPRTWTVDDDGGADFTKIQDAINSATPGDTIYVYNGTYYENLLVEKNNLTLVGENKEATIIDGQGTANVVYITANNITISNFSIQNSGSEWTESGIHLESSFNNILSGNNIINNGAGICLEHSSGNALSDNNMTNNGNTILLLYSSGNTLLGNNLMNNEWGIYLGGSSGNILLSNRIANKYYGIWLYYSSSNTLSGNNITANNGDGIRLEHAENNNIIGNGIANNGNGIWLGASWDNVIYHNNFVNNTVQVYNLHPEFVNVWDDGYPSGGNHWSDYTGVDLFSGPYQNEAGSDGIGDTSYVIDEHNQDKYPLMQPYRGPVRNLNTGHSFSTIQGAINNASERDRIFVLSGTYYENVIVNRTITLLGENKDSIIDGKGTSTVITVTADRAIIDGFTIRNGSRIYPGISLFSQGNKVTNNDIFDNWNGISFAHYSNFNIIANNTIMNNLNGISGELWSDSRIIGNTLKDNLLGIWIGPYSHRNTIAVNNIINHWSEGISMWQSSYNTIVGNNITDNNQGGHWSGMVIGFSSDNQFFHNNIVNKGKLIDMHGEIVNTWDDGYPSGGNHWSDYTGIDLYSGPYQNETGSDGIGDTPYVIDGNNQDNYPLMNPWGSPIVHDVAVVDVLPSVTEAYVGQFVNITVGVRNEETTAETFNVTSHYNNTSIGTQTVVDLGPGENVTLVFSWDTMDVAPGNYTIKAEASILPGEIDTEDNTMISPTAVKVKLLGDVNGDNQVDIRDIATAALAFGSYPSHPKWNSQADINQDDKVDIKDLALIAKNFGKKYP